jgi:superoxide dismutase, Cu-Zn family
MRTIVGCILALVLVASVAASVRAQDDDLVAYAELRDRQGQLIGNAFFAAMPDGVLIEVELTGFTAAAVGAHGIHLYERGQCTPTFEAAGGIFNPTNAQHGLNNPLGPMAGDLPNITIFSGGDATYETINPRITLAPGPTSILGGDGTALIIRAQPDDQATHPDGNTGERIACGVILAEGDVSPLATPTPDPFATPTPDPFATPTPIVFFTPTPIPFATPTPDPFVIPTPFPTLTPVVFPGDLPPAGGEQRPWLLILAAGGALLLAGMVLRQVE